MMDTGPLKQHSESEHTSTKKPRQILKRKQKDTLKAPQEVPKENGCSGEKQKTNKSQDSCEKIIRLFKSFQENLYPDITTRENLAKELQMTVKQVSS
ncbi:hypothetical protein Bca52824_086375 [Brassica carinata]|uniref:Homeobox domain-containing protein n=1 Tax=Brassica carinata TaxID=52824 RepID=A0A8X7P9Z7_BRACI|nr:hypothetical protein Bca52824_086375 [Brassica carinata]